VYADEDAEDAADDDDNYYAANGGNGTEDTTTTINENQTPLAPPPAANSTVTILDEAIPLASLPTIGGAAKKASSADGLLAILGGLFLGLKDLKKTMRSKIF
jgi:hypothetical protein